VYLLSICLFQPFAKASGMRYFLDFNKASKHNIIVKVTLPLLDKNGETLVFPATIPGTYATIDYGRFIDGFTANDVSGRKVEYKKIGRNTYFIPGNTASVSYRVKDTFHKKVRKNKVFEPAGTNIQKGSNLLINAGGFFCYRRGHEDDSTEVNLMYPDSMVPTTAMQGTIDKGKAIFRTGSYHQLVDQPIMISSPDTSSFNVSNCRVQVAVFNDSKRVLSEQIRKELMASMKAISRFFNDTLPVNRYAFIFYLCDYTVFGDAVSGKKPGFFKTLRAASSILTKNFGALEHGNSSVYYLPDLGGNAVVESVKDVAIHEFMHIITPLNLHSEQVGNFNFEHPEMSRHLWLYEGITEYFAGLIQVKYGLISRDNYFNNLLREKFFDAQKFPLNKMSFAEMSMNVLKSPYKEHYNSVYTRGALMGALLDIEIIRLTGGSKNLCSVIKNLYIKYGSQKSFDEKTFFTEFTDFSHPQIADFFRKYVYGREDLPYEEVFKSAGINYKNSVFDGLPVSPLTELKFYPQLSGELRKVKKVKKHSTLPVNPGDLINITEVSASFGRTDSAFLPEGTTDSIQVNRLGQKIFVPIPIRYEKKKMEHLFFLDPNSNVSQIAVRRRWLEP
jgi:predicted metalloprotease with PDZ domain